MSDRTDTGQSDSITAPVFSHIANVKSFAHWFANMQPFCITEIPQTLQYRLLSQRAVLEIQNILFSFKSMHPPGWNFKVWGCCFLDICVYLQYMKLPVRLQQPLVSHTHMSHSSRTEGRTASSGKNTHLFSKSEKTETALTHWLSKRPWNVVSEEGTIQSDDLQTTFLSLRTKHRQK